MTVAWSKTAIFGHCVFRTLTDKAKYH